MRFCPLWHFIGKNPVHTLPGPVVLAGTPAVVVASDTGCVVVPGT